MRELYIIDNPSDPYIELIKDDPVRPEIPIQFRCDRNRRVVVLLDQDGRACAVVCVALLDILPRSVEELLSASSDSPQYCVFYTIWSYVSGAGRELLQNALQWFKDNFAGIHSYVTLSPVSDRVRDFHLGLGAEVYSINASTVNYLYR